MQVQVGGQHAAGCPAGLGAVGQLPRGTLAVHGLAVRAVELVGADPGPGGQERRVVQRGRLPVPEGQLWCHPGAGRQHAALPAAVPSYGVRRVKLAYPTG